MQRRQFLGLLAATLLGGGLAKVSEVGEIVTHVHVKTKMFLMSHEEDENGEKKLVRTEMKLPPQAPMTYEFDGPDGKKQVLTISWG